VRLEPIAKARTLTPEKLQPLEGASGTYSNDKVSEGFNELQPLEGASGTAPEYESVEDEVALQPLEGASGTSANTGWSGSTASFNPSKVRLELGCPKRRKVASDASTPRRCVWNSERRRRR